MSVVSRSSSKYPSVTVAAQTDVCFAQLPDIRFVTEFDDGRPKAWRRIFQ